MAFLGFPECASPLDAVGDSLGFLWLRRAAAEVAKNETGVVRFGGETDPSASRRWSGVNFF